jgi:transposase
MRQKSTTTTSPSERLVKNIRRVTRKQYSAEEKIRIVLDGLRGESSILARPLTPPLLSAPARRYDARRYSTGLLGHLSLAMVAGSISSFAQDNRIMPHEQMIHRAVQAGAE